MFFDDNVVNNLLPRSRVKNVGDKSKTPTKPKPPPRSPRTPKSSSESKKEKGNSQTKGDRLGSFIYCTKNIFFRYFCNL